MSGGKKQVEDIYPLSPMQEGMLFHSLYAPRSGVYCGQTSCALEGDLDTEALHSAWQRLVERHGALRTCFVWEKRDEPFQVVYRQVRLPWEELDWREVGPQRLEPELQRFLAADRERGFDLARPPLLRCTLIRTGESRWFFLWTSHHLLLDGWCLSLLFREVFSLYEAHRRGEELHLPPLRPYRDYIAWLKRQDRTVAAEHWRRELRGLTAPTPLGIDRQPAGGAAAGGYAEQDVRLAAATSAALRLLVQSRDLTLSTLVQGLWGLLLSRLSGEPDVVFGATVSGRPAELPGADSMVGLFINTLPVRVTVAPGEPLLSWLRRLQARLVEMRRYEHSPLVDVQGWSEVPRGRPLFESLVVFENYPVDRALQESPLSLRISEVRSFDRISYPLSLLVLPGECMTLRLKYDQDRFADGAVAQALAQLAGLCEQALRDPERPVGDFSLVTPGAPLPDPAAPLEEPAFATVPERIAALTAVAPERPAVSRGEEVWTYGELAQRADGLARRLTARGLRPGAMVAIQGERSFGLIVSMLAVLRAGGVLLTLDLTLPQARRRLMLERAGATLLLAAGRAEAAGALAAGTGIEVVAVDPGTALTDAGTDAGGELPRLDGAAPAYVFFTSGTTALPKAVLGRHAALSHFLAWQRETFAVGPGDRCAQLTGLSFDVVLRDVFLPLTSGATLCLPGAGQDQGPDAVLPWLEQAGITLLHTVPAVASSWLEAVPPRVTLAALRIAFFAGEPLTGALVRRWREAFPAAGELINLYGPTETTLIKCWWRVPAEPSPGVQPGGFPLPQAQALVLGPGDRRCGVGEPGEIVIRTPFRTLGYLDPLPEDRARFFANPFRQDADDLLYRTGDGGRFRPDGALEILGRLDHQLKIRGVRVEPDEVTAILAQHPGVRAAVVVGKADPQGEPGLAAYWVPAGGEPAEAELREHLAQRLPAAMVPWVFVRLDRLPLSPNGKVERRALPEPQAPAAAAPDATPRTPFEEVVAGIWSEVLHRESIGVAESFFDLGGHSLLATQVVSRLRRTLGVELSLRELFEHPTVAALARRAETLLRERSGSPPPPLRPVPRMGELPLSFSQERLWFLDQLEPGSPMYNVHAGVRLAGLLDAPALARALAEVVRRHEVLRTGFTATREGRARQVVHPETVLDLPRVDLSEVEPRHREAELHRLARESAGTPFDLARPPLLRALLVRLALGEHALLLTLHHIVSDGWSISLLIREVTALYRAFAAGETAALLPLAVQYADFAVWQRQWLQGAVLEAEVEHWRRRLAGAPARFDLPTDRQRPAVQSFRGARASVLLPASLNRGLAALARRSAATPFMLLLAAFQDLLRRYARRDDVVVGTPVAGRNQVEAEELIGFFVNSLVLRTDLAGDPTFVGLLGRVREEVLRAHLHQDLPFEKLVDALQPERSLAYNPLFQVMLVLQNPPSGAGPLPGLSLARLEEEVSTIRLDLTVSAVEANGGLFVLADYASDLFDAPTIQRLLGHLRALLEAAVRDPGRCLSALSPLAGAERHQLLEEWNDTAVPLPADLCLHQLFELQACRTPEAPALVWEEGEWSYRELEARSNRLAHHLRALGVGPESRVGLAVQRSPEMVVAILAILKAGGVYVPLDPEHPVERLALILREAALAALVSVEPLGSRLDAAGVAVVLLDRHRQEIAAQSDLPPGGGAGPGNLAYVLYTSGSTGRPMGVMIPHAGVVGTLLWRQRTYRLGPDDSVMQNIPFSFDPSLWQIFGALGSGARLVLPPPDLQRDAAKLVELMIRRQITVTDFPPSLLRVLLEQPGVEALRRLRHVFAGGEALPPAVRDRFTALLDATLYNIYGPTEAAIDAAVWTCRRGDTHDPVPIGRPIANRQLLLAGPDLGPVPAGAAGELCIAGAGLARGYLGQPDRTAERFVPHPFAAEPGARLYRTGDLVRQRLDGTIVFLGRTDHQVKIRGVRIELGEVEAVVRACAGVAEAAVAVRRHDAGDRLVAFLVAAPGSRLASGTLTRDLQGRLPQAMVPAAFELLAALPQTHAGKLDRQRLAGMQGAPLDAGRAAAAPRTPREALLAAIWSAVLRVERVGVDDNFFELGGDSILSIQIVARARQRGLRITPKQVFQHQTVAELAAMAEELDGGVPGDEPVAGPVPLTPIQRWFFAAGLPAPAHFTQAVLFAVQRPLAPGLLSRAVDRLVRHHDALRLRFRRDAAGWHQEHASPGGAPPFTRIDLSALDRGRCSEAIERAASQTQQSLELAAGPLLRVVLCDGQDLEPGRLLIVIHHLAVDGLSWRILLEDLQNAYQRLAAGGEPELPARSSSFKAWAERLAGHARSPALLRELDHWLVVPPRRPAPLPVDLPGGEAANDERSVDTVAAELDAAETRALLQELPAASRARIDEVLLTALVRALAPWLGERGLLVELEGHGREELFEDLDLSRTVGWFTSIYPAFLDLGEAVDPGEALKTVKEQLRRIPARGIGFGLLRYLGPESAAASLAVLPRPEVSFNYLGQFEQVGAADSLFAPARESAGELRDRGWQRLHLLEISGLVAGGRLGFQWRYSRNLHRRSTIVALSDRFLDELRAILSHFRTTQDSSYTPSDFPLIQAKQGQLDRLIEKFTRPSDQR
jgi:amino acid adenylation domain-containing protein/non-ribosomal peptide synthase protein (TIGR01720 family)